MVSMQIMIIDDQNVVRKAMRRLIERNLPNAEVHEFSSTKDSIQHLKNNPTTLIFLDLYMPGGNGFEVISYVRSRPIASDIPIVVVSGEATKEDIVHCVDLGATDYVLKPFEPNDFTNKVTAVLKAYQNPNEKILSIREAEACLIKGDLNGANTILSDLKKQEPTWPRMLVAYAQLCEKKNMFDAALSYVRQAIDANPLYFAAYNIGANVAIKQNRTTDAIDLLTKELAINGKQPGRRRQLAELYASINDYANAQENLRQALITDPKNEDLLLSMADMQQRNGDVDKAVHYFLKTRRQNPQSQKAMEGLIEVCIKNNRVKHAENTLTDLLKLNPGQKDLLFTRAKFYERTKEVEKALTDVNNYLEAVHDNVEALKFKIKILNDLQQYEEAYNICEKVAKIAPDADIFGKQGVLAFRLGKNESAIDAYKAALKLDPTNIKFHYNLGYAYEVSEQIAFARAAYELTLTYDPKHADAKEAMARINRKSGVKPPAGPLKGPGNGGTSGNGSGTSQKAS